MPVMRQSTLCTLVQGFPVLLIIAQNTYRCLETPLIYKPPAPTASPEYIEAFNTLYQSLYNSHGHGYGDHGYGEGYGGSYGYGQGSYGHGGYGQGPYGNFGGYDHKPPHNFPGVSYKPYEYPHGNGYPGIFYKKFYNVSTGPKGYAPGQVYNVKNRYKIVVKNKGRKKSQKIVQGFFSNRDDRSQNPNFNIPNLLNPNRIRNRLTGLLHLRPEDRDSNPGFVLPFRRPGITNTQTGNPASQYDSYGGNYQNYPNQYGYNTIAFPTEPTNDRQNEPNYGQNVNFNSPNGNQYPPYYGNNQYQPYDNNQYQQNNNNGNQYNPYETTKDIPNDPVNFEEPSSTEVVIDPVKVVENPTEAVIDPVKVIENPTEAVIDPVKVVENPTEAVIDPVKVVEIPVEPQNDQRHPVPLIVSGTVNFGDQNVVTKLPELTPVPATDKRDNFNFGSAGIFQETCQTVDDEIGSCISILSCEPYLRVIRDSRTNPGAVQLLRRAHCGFEGNNPKVCCPRPGIPSHPSEPVTTTTTTTAAPETPSPPPEDPAEGKTAGEFLDELPTPPVCGKNDGSVSRVVGGDPAQLGAFPWMAILGYKPKRGGAGARWLCGGSLASSRHVITAAHCIHLLEDSLFLVRLGELDLASENDGATPVDVLIKKMMKHEQYNSKTHINDIGLLLLDKDVQFTSLIRPICLPQESQYRSQTFENTTPLIAGWGAIEYRGPSASHLQVAQLPVVDNTKCARAYSNYSVVRIDESIICAGEKLGRIDACQGDSGGPLMQPLLPNGMRVAYIYQIGVVSFGKKCAEKGFPGVYSRITHFMPWLQEKMLGAAK